MHIYTWHRQRVYPLVGVTLCTAHYEVGLCFIKSIDPPLCLQVGGHARIMLEVGI